MSLREELVKYVPYNEQEENDKKVTKGKSSNKAYLNKRIEKYTLCTKYTR